MKKNRIFAMSLATLFCVSSLTACTSKENTNDNKLSGSEKDHNHIEAPAGTPNASGDEVFPASKAEAKKLADEITKRARDGEDFYSLVEEYGEDPGMVNNPEGYLFTYGTMVKEFEEASFALEVGEISDPVETPYGYHIIKKLPLDLDPASAEYLDIAYAVGGDKLTTELAAYVEGLEVEYTDAFNELTVMNMGTSKVAAENDTTAVPGLDTYDWKHSDNEVMFYVGTAPVTFGEYRYYAMGNKVYMDNNNDSYWTEETEAEYKNTLVEQFKQFVGIKLLATSEAYGLELEDSDYEKIDETISSYKTQFGEDGFAEVLNEIFVNEAIFEYMLEYDLYTEKLLLANASAEEIEKYAAENYVRVQHVLVSFTEEEVQTAK